MPQAIPFVVSSWVSTTAYAGWAAAAAVLVSAVVSDYGKAAAARRAREARLMANGQNPAAEHQRGQVLGP